MKRAALCLIALAACKKNPPAPVDAGTATAVTKDVVVDAAPPPEEDAAPPVDAGLHIVARGTAKSHVIWLKAMGQRMWLSAQNLDAFADGDGPLVKGTDPFAKLPYTPGVHDLQATGMWPHIFAMRTKKVMGRMASPEPTFFVYQPDGTWAEAKWSQKRPLALEWFPHAFVGYRDGALMVTSQAELNNTPSYFPNLGPGTETRFVAPDGTITDPKIDVHPAFVAYNADSDNKTLTLLGTIGVKSKTDPGGWEVNGVHISRLVDGGKAKITAIVRGPWPFFDNPYWIKIHEHGDHTLLVPGNGGGVWLVDGDGNVTVRAVPVGKSESHKDDSDPATMTIYDCRLTAADLIGDDVWAIRSCLQKPAAELVRVGPTGKAETVALEKGCSPQALVVRQPADLWVHADCNDGPAIFRLGRAQTPIVMP